MIIGKTLINYKKNLNYAIRILKLMTVINNNGTSTIQFSDEKTEKNTENSSVYYCQQYSVLNFMLQTNDKIIKILIFPFYD